jgi:uncharacterized radical SAM protein YgiQ
MFLPATLDEVHQRGWDALDVILVSGDAYIDSPHMGVAVVARVLDQAGFRVGVIAQPDWRTSADIARLGQPRLFWGVSAGSVDSMVANYTPLLKKRRSDDFTPGGINQRRPDRAVIVYANLIRRRFKTTAPIVLGGIEASLRRISHYDYWSDRVRRSILFDAKADYLLYGMADHTAVMLAKRLQDGATVRDIPGLCYIADRPPPGSLPLPDHALVADDLEAFRRMYRRFVRHNDPVRGLTLCQRQDSRWLIQNPPPPPLSTAELDAVHALDFQRAVHPRDAAQGTVKALETIRFALASHRGCYGQCSFCAIAIHQGRTIQWRSPEALIAEAQHMQRHPAFRGVILDVGGPTANMYGFECPRKLQRGACRHRRCLYPEVCPQLPVDHGPQRDLLRRLRRIPGIKRVFVASGLRHDLVLADGRQGQAYLEDLVRHHISGQLKIAPEHSAPDVLALMGKPGIDSLRTFRRRFQAACAAAGKRQYLTYYFMAAHPGCEWHHMQALRRFTRRELKLAPQQVQIFTPTPGTHATLMYWTGRDAAGSDGLFCEKRLKAKRRQKEALLPSPRDARGRPRATGEGPKRRRKPPRS